VWWWQRRDKKTRAKRAKMLKHGKRLMQFYANAVLKRLRSGRKKRGI
jgi:hypothetical protein